MPEPQLTGPIRFGVFEVDPHSAVVRKRGVRIRLQDQPFRVLLALLEHAGEVVTREELQRKNWPESTFGDLDHNLNIAINKIRETLGDSSENPRFVETLPRRGYRFIAPLESSTAPAVAPASAQPAVGRERKPKWILLAAALGLLVLAAAITIWLLSSGPPQELQVRRLTHDNSPKFNPVLSDGARLYFRAGTRTDWHIFQVPLAGGEPVRLPVVLPTARLNLLDITADGQELLLTASESPPLDSDPLWTVRIADGSSRRVGALSALDASYSPDGGRIAFTQGEGLAGSLSVSSSDGSNARLLLAVKGLTIVAPTWSPDGQRIVFGQPDQAAQFGSTWAMMADGSGVRRLFPDWQDTHLPAGWTPDGRLLVVSQGRLWTVPFRRFFQFTLSPPVPISATEPRFDGPLQLRGSRNFHAVGSTPLGQLQRFDSHRKGWEPHLGGISAETVEYSRDGERVAYATYPEREVCARRADGSQPVHLTKRPMQAWIPRWSPDGRLIAFTGKTTPDQPWRIYLMDSEGGAAHPACRGDCGPQGDFTWAPDGKTIVYAAPNQEGNPADAQLRVLDIKTGNATNLQGSKGFYSPRWSPDGSALAALVDRGTVRTRGLSLYRPADGKWVEAAGPDSGFMSWPSWSHDSKSIWYFNRLRGTIGRYDVQKNRHEDVVPVKPEELAGPVYWFSLTPNNEPMILRRRDIQEIYAVDWK